MTTAVGHKVHGQRLDVQIAMQRLGTSAMVTAASTAANDQRHETLIKTFSQVKANDLKMGEWQSQVMHKMHK